MTKEHITNAVVLLGATFLMGSSFAVGKIGLEYAPPFMLAGMRFVLGGGLLLLWICLWKRLIPTVEQLWKSFVIGTLQTAGVMGCIFVSMLTISASESSILTFSNPLFVLIFSSVLLGAKYHITQWIGVGAGLAGVAVALGAGFSFSSGTWIGLAGAVFWAAATLFAKKWGTGMNIWLLTALQMTFGGLLLLVLGAGAEGLSFQWNAVSLAALLWLAVPGSIVQFGLWYLLLQRMEPSVASSFLFLAPVFGVTTGVLWLGEPMSVSLLAGAALVCLGIFLVNFRPAYAKKPISR